MRITVEPVRDGAVKSRLCAEITAELPMWFGQPESNARYVSGIADRDVLAAALDGRIRGIVALEGPLRAHLQHLVAGREPHGASARPRQGAHRAGGRAGPRPRLPALGGGDREPPLEQSGIRADARFYEAVGFVPFVEFEPEPGAYMMWMLRDL